MERDERLLFEGIELEEPSASVDEAILARAGQRRSAPARGRFLARLALAAGLSIGLLVLWSRNGPPVGPAETGAASAPAPLEEIQELLGELDQINEMSELISPEKQAEREAILTKIKACLSTISALEEKLLRFDQGSLNEVSRKETRI
jgi:hypothetical protein